MAQSQFRVRGGLLSDSDITLNNTPTTAQLQPAVKSYKWIIILMSMSARSHK